MPAEYRQRIEQLADVVGLGDDIAQAAQDVLGRDEAQARDHPQPDAPAARSCSSTSRRPASTRSAGAACGTTCARSATPDGTTIFLTTHYLEEAEEADRVCVIDHGRIAVIGTPDEMKRAAARSLGRCSTPPTGRRSRPSSPALGLTPESTTRPGALRVAYDGVDRPGRSSPASRRRCRVLRVHEPSLEEAYVELLRQPEEAVA